MSEAASAPPSIKDQMEDATPPKLATELPASTGSSGQATVAAQIEPAPEAAAGTAADDLSQIAGITSDDADILHDAGVTTFAAIASWTADDVRQIKARIAGDRRIARENWIEQAKLLTLTGSTAYTRRVQAALAAAPATVVPANPALAPAAAVTAPPSVDVPVTTTTAETPAKAAPVSVMSEVITPEPSTTNVEPATSATASDAIPPVTAEAAAAAAAIASHPGAAGPTSESTPAPTAPPPMPASTPDVAQRAAFAREPSRYADNLQEIDGVNAEVEKLLHEQGVTRIAQIADWTVDEQQRIDRLLGGMNRVHRENWVGQARRICGLADVPSEGEVPGLRLDMPADEIQLGDSITGEGPVVAAEAASVAPVIPNQQPPADVEARPNSGADRATSQPESKVASITNQAAGSGTNVRNLRSVRSEALVGTNAAGSSGTVDDLKRIRGIGVLIEKRLRAMGYGSYEQIGSWTQSDVHRVNQQLDFRGRIERENWIEQARILAAGGQTEFSRRHETDE
ncbi:MAG: hypothetical protein ACR2PI_03265 [Hyphomicrobiaceae bacterium]